jgi:hypothetical protein
VIKRVLAGVALATLLSAAAAKADTVNFTYSDQGVDQATGEFTYANGATGVLGYGDLTSFSLTVAGVTYDLADVLPLTDYVHFAYDTGANVFLTDPNTCGFDGCGFPSSLSAINSNGTYGFFFDPVPGAYSEYSAPAYNVAIDSLTLTHVAGAPEPAAWALMLMGFGSAGALLRAQRRRAVATVRA